MIVMIQLLFIVFELRAEIDSCCGVSLTQTQNGGIISENEYLKDFDSYQTCADLDISSQNFHGYTQIFSNLKSVDSFGDLYKLFKVDEINITVASNGGCLYQNTNCFTEGVGSCAATVCGILRACFRF